MKNKFAIFIFIVIPVLLFISTYHLKISQGPYYINSQYDPSYVYLISSLNLAQVSGFGVGHIDHPGTPVQIIGAAAIWISYFFSAHDKDMISDVLMNPEKYLNGIEYMLLFINCIGLFILGIVSYKVYSKISVSILLQLTPFTSLTIISLTTLIRPENFLIFVVSIFISTLILYAKEKGNNSKKNLPYIILLGVISGLGVAAKISFFPLLLIPLVLFRGIKYKLIYLLTVLVSFLIFVLPAISSSNIKYFAEWVFNLFIHSKKYGRGDPTIVDYHSFLYKIRLILNKEWIFDIAYFMVSLTFVLTLFRLIRYYLKSSGNKLLKKAGSLNEELKTDFTGNFESRLLTSIFFAMTLQILIVAKHYGEYYMFPVLLLSVYSLTISIPVIMNFLNFKLTRKISYSVNFTLMLLFATFIVWSIVNYDNQLKFMTKESNEIEKYLEENSGNSIVVSAHHVPRIAFALFNGTSYSLSAREHYNSILFQKYPADIFYLDKLCFTFSSDPSYIDNRIKSADQLLFLCASDEYLENFKILLNSKYGISNAVCKKKYINGNGEMVYEIRLN